MSKAMKKTIFGILGGIVLMLLIGFLPPETEMMTRAAWQYVGCFAFLLTCLISGALPDWVATLATMFMILVFKIGTVANVTSQFAGTTVWLCIGVFLMSIGINNSGFMKRLALWVLTKFPGTYSGQVTAMLLAGILEDHVAEIDRQAVDMIFRLIDEMAKQESVTEQLKARDPMEWTRQMNIIRSRAVEIVNADLIYT